MRLKFIKLAGFKSFVDPTKVPFEQQMTAIVGPNGCGKSNIIDAVRWVLGESSAKNLRGDAMTDVIFNGAASRKPIGQASVELVFDNINGRITGSMADRNEVSIRRVVNRDSQNTYYLNGSKCRRKDITDIFLGTGLGPRSYAIIEQGTISKLIESKPQDLRIFIEEAAGISKYKERRRETETRIRHTRENLQRLTDIRLELGHQIDKLHQQAEAAKRFKTLKTQERKYKAELAVLRWKKYDQQAKNIAIKLTDQQQKIAQQQLLQKEQDVIIFANKQESQLGQEAITGLQQQKLQLTNDIARAELRVKHLKQQQLKTSQDKQVCQQQLINAQQGLSREQDKLDSAQLQLNDIEPKLAIIAQQITTVTASYQQSVNLQKQHQHQWQAYHLQQAELASEKLLATKYIAEQEAAVSQASKRLVELQTALIQLDEQTVQISNEDLKSIERLTAELAVQIPLQSEVNQSLEVIQHDILQVNQQKAELTGLQQSQHYLLTQLKNKLQQQDWSTKQSEWLRENSLITSGQLVDNIEVTKGWELAVEIVLSDYLQSDLLNQLPDVKCLHEKCNQTQLPDTLFLTQKLSCIDNTEQNRATNNNKSIKAPRLIDMVDGDVVFPAVFANVYCANSLAQAEELLLSLSGNESVICQDGLWLSKQFIRKGTLHQHSDVLQNKNHMAEIEVKLVKSADSFATCEKRLKELLEAKQSKTQLLAKITTQISSAQQQLVTHNQNKALAEQAKQNTELQKQQLLIEQTNLQQAKSLAQKSLVSLVEGLDKNLNKDQSKDKNDGDNSFADNATNQEQKLTKQKFSDDAEKLQQDIQTQQTKLHQLTNEKHQLHLLLEKNKNTLDQCQQSVARFQENIKQLSKQQQQSSQQIDDNVQPLIEDEQQLQLWLTEMTHVDEKLLVSHQAIANFQQRVVSAEQKQKALVEKINHIKESLNKYHIEVESFNLKAEAALAQLAETGHTNQTILQNMPENAKESQWQAQLIKLAKDIGILGAINLAAIDEYETQLSRKNYLDQQDQDLTQAISTLESAIAKIDKESRYKFKETFEQVNKDLQKLFPKVFGGGHAYLALTGEDMLDTGVTIMARPPGKKNSTIHLLSGGEKALTALSLVFAIFRLNPAPFCMLDEVDAPLDDANVSRFCNLVREMSQTVQFVYISHNKIAMEMATHLTGVTMFEPGVSRMVAVDIDEAIAMAEVS